MQTSDKIENISKALVAVQKEMKDVVKNSKNPFLDSNYADLPAVLQVARPLLSKNGIALIQFAENPDGKPTVTTRLLHETGEFIETELSLPMPSGAAEKTNAVQKFGSVVTYLRRYAVMALCGMGAEDEDGADLDSPAPTLTAGKGKTKTEPPREMIIQDRISALPKDLKDLMLKAGATSFQQQYAILKTVAWNFDAAKKLCLDEIKKKEG